MSQHLRIYRKGEKVGTPKGDKGEESGAAEVGDKVESLGAGAGPSGDTRMVELGIGFKLELGHQTKEVEPGAGVVSVSPSAWDGES